MTDALRERVARELMRFFSVDPDVFVGIHGGYGHWEGAAEAAIAAMPAPVVKDSLTGDVAELVEDDNLIVFFAVAEDDELVAADAAPLSVGDIRKAATKLTELAAEVVDCMATIAIHQDMYRKLMDQHRSVTAELRDVRVELMDKRDRLEKVKCGS